MKTTSKLGFIDLYLPLYPIIQAYSTFYSLIIFIIYGMYKIIITRKIKINIIYISFIFVVFLNHIILFYSNNMSLNHFLVQFRNFTMFSFIIFTLYDSINFKYFLKTYRLLSLLLSFIVIYQFILISFFRITISPVKLFGLDFIEPFYDNSNRPMGFFTEPQKIATYLLPLITIELNQKNYFKSFLWTFIVILSMSMQGIITVLVIYLLVILYKFKFNLKNFGFVIGCIFILLLFLTDEFALITERISTIGLGYSDYLRLFKSYDTYIELPFFNQLFGIGLNNIDNFIINNGFYFSWMTFIMNEVMFSYMSSGFGIFVELGLLASLLYYFFLLVVCFKNRLSKLLVITIVIQMFSQTFIFNYAFIFYLLIVLNINNLNVISSKYDKYLYLG